MSAVTITLLVLALVSYVLKSAGPVLLGDRHLPVAVTRVTQLIPAPLLAALVLTSTVVDGTSLRIDARLVGLVAAAIALHFRAGFVVVVAVAATATALARAFI